MHFKDFQKLLKFSNKIQGHRHFPSRENETINPMTFKDVWKPGPWHNKLLLVFTLPCTGGKVKPCSRAQGQLKGSVKELNIFHNYETEKITRKASDMAEYIE